MRAITACVLVASLITSSPAAAADTDELHAYRRTVLCAHDVLKLRGEFGQGLYVGRVTSIQPTGLSGFTDDAKWRTGLPKPEEPLAWERIASVEYRGNESAKGALIGMAIVVPIGVMFGMLLGSTESDLTSAEAISVGAAGGLAGAYVGGGLGAVIGAAFPAWHRVYSRPSTEPE
jgi:hypothetical protein